jgi:hypothetical protein
VSIVRPVDIPIADRKYETAKARPDSNGNVTQTFSYFFSFLTELIIGFNDFKVSKLHEYDWIVNRHIL